MAWRRVPTEQSFLTNCTLVTHPNTMYHVRRQKVKFHKNDSSVHWCDIQCSVQKCATSCTISPASYVLPYLMQHRLVKNKGTQYTPSSQRTRNNTLHKHGQRCWFESHTSPIMHTCLPLKVGQGALELWQWIKISNSCPLSEATTWGKLINCKVIILEQRLRLRLLTFALPPGNSLLG